MSAKRPRAFRSRIRCSVSAYGAAGAAPITSIPSSWASRSSSTVVTAPFLRLRRRAGHGAEAARVAGDLALRDRQLDARVDLFGLGPAGDDVAGLDREPLGGQPVAEQVALVLGRAKLAQPG